MTRGGREARAETPRTRLETDKETDECPRASHAAQDASSAVSCTECVHARVHPQHVRQRSLEQVSDTTTLQSDARWGGPADSGRDTQGAQRLTVLAALLDVRLFSRFAGSDASADAAGAAAAAPASLVAAPVAAAAAGPPSGAQGGAQQSSGGRGGGGGRGGRGGQARQTARSMQYAQQQTEAAGGDGGTSGAHTQRERGSGSGGHRGGRGGGRGGSQQGQQQQGSSAEASGSENAAGGRGGRGGARGGRGGNNTPRPASAQPRQQQQQQRHPQQQQQQPPQPGAQQLDGDAAPLSPSPSSATSAPPQPQPPQQPQQPRGPSRKEQAAASRAAAEAARLDDPSNPLNVPSAALATELKLLGVRYNKSFTSSSFRSSLSCQFSFTPSDPDFPFALPPEAIVLQFLFHDVSLFPYAELPPPNGSNDALRLRLAARVQVQCLNQEKDIPAYMREVIEGSLHYFIAHTQFGKPPLMRNTLKMLDREIITWLQLAQKKQNAKVEQTMRKLLGGPGAAAAMAATAAANAAAASSAAAGSDGAASDATASSPSTTSASTGPSASLVSSSASLPSLSPSPPAAAASSSAIAASSSSSAPAAASAVPAAADGADPVDEWSASDQSLLESALKSVPRTLPAAERWDAIAAGVPGKTKKQVLARYKTIRDAVKNSTVDTVKIASAPAAAASSSSSSSSSSVLTQAPPLAASFLHLSNARDSDADEVASVHAARVRAQQIEREMDALSIREAQMEEDERMLAMGKIPKKKKEPKKKEPVLESKEADSEATGSDDDNEDEDDEEEGFDQVSSFTPVTERLSLNPQHRGTQLLIGELHMVGLGILKSSMLRVQVLCVRCETRSDIEFGPSNGASNPVAQRCARCGIHHSLRYRPEMVHEHSDSLGYVDLVNCECFDLLPCDLFGTCLECFTEAPIKQLQRGQAFDSNCRQCHTRLMCRFDQFEFARLTPAALIQEEPKQDTRGRKAAELINPAEVAAAKNRKKEQALLKVGTALPNKGSCKHYKHSYRWMRSADATATVRREGKTMLVRPCLTSLTASLCLLLRCSDSPVAAKVSCQRRPASPSSLPVRGVDCVCSASVLHTTCFCVCVWIRVFSAYPCDECHNEAEDHKGTVRDKEQAACRARLGGRCPCCRRDCGGSVILSGCTVFLVVRCVSVGHSYDLRCVFEGASLFVEAVHWLRSLLLHCRKKLLGRRRRHARSHATQSQRQQEALGTAENSIHEGESSRKESKRHSATQEERHRKHSMSEQRCSGSSGAFLKSKSLN